MHNVNTSTSPIDFEVYLDQCLEEMIYRQDQYFERKSQYRLIKMKNAETNYYNAWRMLFGKQDVRRNSKR